MNRPDVHWNRQKTFQQVKTGHYKQRVTKWLSLMETYEHHDHKDLASLLQKR